MNNSLIRFDKTHRLSNLPKISSPAFLVNNQIAYTGSMITRPVKNTLHIYKHFGFIYGADKSNTIWVIENNIRGVECISLRDFLQGCTSFEVTPNGNHILCALVMERARWIAQKPYDSRTNNCEHFVNYCLNGKHESIQTARTEGVANILLSIGEIAVCNTTNLKGIITKEMDGLRNNLNLKRPENVQKILNNINGHKEQPSVAVLEPNAISGA